METLYHLLPELVLREDNQQQKPRWGKIHRGWLPLAAVGCHLMRGRTVIKEKMQCAFGAPIIPDAEGAKQ
jgi:hypothetical protein